MSGFLLMFSTTVLAYLAKCIHTCSNPLKFPPKTGAFQGENVFPQSENNEGISSGGHLGVQPEQEE